MVIRIEQVASNIRQTYNIECESRTYFAEAGRWSVHQPVTMQRPEREIVGKAGRTSLRNHIPFASWFGMDRRIRRMAVTDNGRPAATFELSVHGINKSRYVLTVGSTELSAYDISDGSFNYLCIYREDTQIAQLETYLSTTNYQYRSQLYLLDEYADMAEVLAFLAVYYINHRFSRRFHMTYGSQVVREKTLSAYKDKYDPDWQKTHFPDVNFWGPIHPFGA